MGYIPKTSEPTVTTSAIKFVLSGGIYIPPHVLQSMENTAARDQTAALLPMESDTKQHHLTRRQLQVLTLISQGRSNKAIAKELGITPGTIKMHSSRIFKILKAENRTEAAAKFVALKKND